MIAFLGGIFDPPHFGHLKPALELTQRPEITQLRFLPCYQPPHKQTATSDVHRLTMLKLIEKPPAIVVDDYEIERRRVSYTVDSLRHFRRQVGDQQSLAFVLGQDTFQEIASWSRYRQLLELVHLIVTVRPGYTISDDHVLLQASGGWAPLSELAQVPAGKTALFENQTWDVSSSDLREMIARGGQPRYLMPGVVWNYIRRHRLYGCRENAE